MVSARHEALAVRRDGWTVDAEVHEGWDVFGAVHGGYLAALAGHAVLVAAEQPDLFTITTHFLARAEPGPLAFHVAPVGGSRRFTSVRATAVQGDRPVLAVLASVGDRGTLAGPSWTSARAWDPDGARLTPPAGHPDLPFVAPAVAERLGLRLDAATVGFARGVQEGGAVIRAVTDTDDVDQLTALIACDVTPPPMWNALAPTGWVPTVELTAHLRARPVAGPLTVEATSTHLTDGFLDEDAVVRDAAGTLVCQSRQLARWTQPRAA